MCFSPAVSFAASAGLLAIGVIAIRRTATPSHLWFAAIPLLFAIQQAAEGMVWMSFEWGDVSLRNAATQVYSVFSLLLWPMYVPFATRAIESDRRRRRVLAWLTVAGLVGAAFLAVDMAVEPVQVQCLEGRLRYETARLVLPLSVVLYLVATTGSMMISSRRFIRLFGAAAVVSAGVAWLLFAQWFISVWCFYAAVLSLIVLFHRDPVAALPPAQKAVGNRPLELTG